MESAQVDRQLARTSEFTGKAVLVAGMARSGLACADVLNEHGSHVLLYDSKTTDQLQKAADEANRLGIKFCTGGESVDLNQVDYVITSPGIPKSAAILQQAIRYNVPIISEIEAAYRISLAPILAITGTNGKTTTTVLLGEILRSAGHETYIGGNVAAGDIGMPLIKACHIASSRGVIAAEISSFQLEWIDRFRPKIAALLNISPDHEDRQTWSEYVSSKWRIFENQRSQDTAVLSNELASDIRAKSLSAKVVVFEDFNGGNSVTHEVPVVNRKLPGAHNRKNINAASAMAKAYGVSDSVISEAVLSFPGVVHRLEYVATIDNIRYINNSMCTNSDAFGKSLEAIPEPKVVIAGGVFKGADLVPIANSVASFNVRHLLLIGRSAKDIESAVRAIGFVQVSFCNSLQHAVWMARRIAASGDTIILAPACASFDMFNDFEDRGSQFKAIVNALGGDRS